MKFRDGFVPNSSSSSFVVLLPQGFDPSTLPYETALQSMGGTVQVYDEDGKRIEEPTDEQAIETMKGWVKKFISDGCWWQGDGGLWRCIDNLFGDYIIAEIDGAPDQGSVKIADAEKAKKILAA